MEKWSVKEQKNKNR